MKNKIEKTKSKKTIATKKQVNHEIKESCKFICNDRLLASITWLSVVPTSDKCEYV